MLVFWGWTGGDPQNNYAYLNDFFYNIGNTRWWKTVSQYYGLSSDCSSAFYVGEDVPVLATYYDSSSPGSNPTTADEANMLSTYVAAQGYRTDTVYFVLLPPGTTGPVSGSDCAAHDIFTYGSAAVAVAELPYQSTAGCGWGTVGSGVVSNAMHELAEAITDYDGGWTDSTGAEIGDLCQSVPTNMGLLASTTLVGQQLWSNDTGDCVSAYTNDVNGGSRDSSGNAWTSDGLYWQGYLGPLSSSNWGKPSSGASIVSDVASATWPHGDTHTFMRDSNGHVQERYGWGWTDWGVAPTGYAFVDAPSAAGWGEQRWDIFSAAADSGGTWVLMHWVWDNGSYYGVHNLGSPSPSIFTSCTMGSGPTAVAADVGRVDAFLSATCDGNPAVLDVYCTSASNCNSGSFGVRLVQYTTAATGGRPGVAAAQLESYVAGYSSGHYQFDIFNIDYDEYALYHITANSWNSTVTSSVFYPPTYSWQWVSATSLGDSRWAVVTQDYTGPFNLMSDVGTWQSMSLPSGISGAFQLSAY